MAVQKALCLDPTECGSGEQMIMRTSNECRAMACEMERKADSCPTRELETEFLDLAKTWRASR